MRSENRDSNSSVCHVACWIDVFELAVLNFSVVSYYVVLRSSRSAVPSILNFSTSKLVVWFVLSVVRRRRHRRQSQFHH